jgi:hypothetical protein
MRSVAGRLATLALCGLNASPMTASSASAASGREQIEAIAAQSSCAGYHWKNRGRAPLAYIKGMALVFGKAVCHAEDWVQDASAARGTLGTAADNTDAAAWYDAQFRALGMSNDNAGLDTLRHLMTLQLGLGMQESSGKYCVGRDTSAHFDTADSAEAGTFQTSWGVSRVSSILPAIFERYRADQSGCLLDVFRVGVTCSAADAETFGSGTGADWQQLTKACPAFAAQYAAVVIRHSGGRKGEFGPLRRHQAEIRPECDAMFAKVQALVQGSPDTCASLQ